MITSITIEIIIERECCTANVFTRGVYVVLKLQVVDVYKKWEDTGTKTAPNYRKD